MVDPVLGVTHGTREAERAGLAEPGGAEEDFGGQAAFGVLGQEVVEEGAEFGGEGPPGGAGGGCGGSGWVWEDRNV